MAGAQVGFLSDGFLRQAEREAPLAYPLCNRPTGPVDRQGRHRTIVRAGLAPVHASYSVDATKGVPCALEMAGGQHFTSARFSFGGPAFSVRPHGVSSFEMTAPGGDSRAGLLIRRVSGPWRSPEVQAYQDEDMLKLMLRDSPQLLALCSEGTVFVDELTVPLIGSVDLAGVGPNGDVTLVECKLASNPEIRRSIIGQILAYASGLWRMSYEDFDRIFSARLSGMSLADAIRRALGESAPDWPEDQFRANVTDNLAAGCFTLVIAVDRITDELKRIVPYVNTHTVDSLRFLALEVGYVKDGDIEVVLPLTYGQESAGEKQTSRRRTWSVEAYFERLREYGQAPQSFLQAIADFSRENGAVLEGGTGASPSLNARFHIGGEQKTVWSSYFQKSGPSFDLNFEYLRQSIPSDALSECAQIMRSIEHVGPRYASLKPDFGSRPSLPIDPILTQPGATESVKRALLALLEAAPKGG